MLLSCNLWLCKQKLKKVLAKVAEQFKSFQNPYFLEFTCLDFITILNHFG